MAKRKAKPARKTGRKRAAKGARKARTAAVRKAARKAPKKKAPAPRRRSGQARKAAPKKKAAPRRPLVQARKAPAKVVARKAPSLERQRRTVVDEDLVPSPPSSLDLDRTASAARSGRRELSEKFRQHTETSPALTGGDIDADWESAYSVGDEAPGGDNPTPDQDIVDDIGKAIGVVYEDNEELKGEKKISDRDRKRWELDPASSDDYEDR
ncbi:MAG: hypothetical protein FJW14_00655 [Acidimicrobiia bacterium]|nr:hypothetical protein [Acidimicrobiia bacterium]